MLVVIAALVLLYTGYFVYRGWRGATSRLELAAGALEALLVLVAAHRLTPWADVAEWLWFIPLGVAVAGVVGSVYRWPTLPVTSPKRSPRRAWIVAGIHAAVVIALVGVLVWPAA